MGGLIRRRFTSITPELTLGLSFQMRTTKDMRLPTSPKMDTTVRIKLMR